MTVFSLHAVLTQLLSNVISPVSAEPDAARIADDRLAVYLSGRREDDVIVYVSLQASNRVAVLNSYRRLLDSKDTKTNAATLHLLNNVTRNSSNRMFAVLHVSLLAKLTSISEACWCVL